MEQILTSVFKILVLYSLVLLLTLLHPQKRTGKSRDDNKQCLTVCHSSEANAAMVLGGLLQKGMLLVCIESSSSIIMSFSISCCESSDAAGWTP